jgi:hypothetical protein
MQSVNASQVLRGWKDVNEVLVERVRQLDEEQLAWAMHPASMPAWAVLSHLAGTRVYWLCGPLGEPGLEMTPFRLDEDGWEDQPDHPRGAEELAGALESTWKLVESCIERWNLADYQREVEVETRRGPRIQTPQLVVMRLVMHDAAHISELSGILTAHGLPEVPWWSPLWG